MQKEEKKQGKEEMKSQKIKSKALRLYITNVPIYRIAKQLKLAKDTVYSWKDKGNWDKLKADELTKQGKNSTEEIIKDQKEIVTLAAKTLLKRLKEEYPDIKSSDLITLIKHGLEIVRPRQTTNNLNLTKNENLAIQVNIPKEVKELLDGIQSNSKASISIPETN